MSKIAQIQPESDHGPGPATSSMKFTTSQVDSYWVPGDALAEEPAESGSRPEFSPDLPVAADEFEAIYHWFLS